MQNVSAACAALGRFYWFGLGTATDDFAGLGWTFKAAEMGEPQALKNLGQYFVNDADRIILAGLRKAANAGIADAQYALGQHLEAAKGLEHDIHAAIYNYQNAANQGHAQAQCVLGLIFSEGRGVPLDIAKARDWFLKSAHQGNAKAQWNLALMLISGAQGVKKDLKQAFVLCQKSAVQGFVPAQASLGILYARMKKPESAVEWWQVAARQGDPEAQFNLALALSKGSGVAQDATLALEWLTKAAEQGVASAQSKLGLLYATGDGVALDPIEAHKWFVVASQNGDSAAQANVMHSESQMDHIQIAEANRRTQAWLEVGN
jgi:TPR repeat protein